jgi:hypothetical protein
MRYIYLQILCFVCVAISYGQTQTRSYHTILVEITKEKKARRVYTKVKSMEPAFPAGDSSWTHSLQDSLNQSLSVQNKAKPGTYIISVRFLIEKDGSVSDIVCLKDPGFGICEQVKVALREKFKWGRQVESSHEVGQNHTESTTPQDE